MNDAQPPSMGSTLSTFPVLFALVCFHSAIAFAYFHARTTLLFCVVIFGSVAVVYFFWHGRNWARIVVMLTAATDFILDIPRLGHSPPLMQFVLSLRLLTAAVLIIWLNTSAVRTYFRRIT
jgi:hypothetical protein